MILGWFLAVCFTDSGPVSGSFCQIRPAIALALASDDMKMGSFTMSGESEMELAMAFMPWVSHFIYLFGFYSCSNCVVGVRFQQTVVLTVSSRVIQVRTDQGLVVKIRCPMRS